MEDLLARLDEAIAKMETALPSLDKEKVAHLLPLIESMKNRRRIPLLEGYHTNPMRGSKLLRDIQDLMVISRDLLVPLALQAEVQKIRNLRNLVAAQGTSVQLSEASHQGGLPALDAEYAKLSESLSERPTTSLDAKRDPLQDKSDG